jgi:primosomal protein N' (replication factor Y)
VPFRKKLRQGFVIKEFSDVESEFSYNVEEVTDVIDSLPLLSEKDFDFLEWMSDYYVVPLGQIVFNALPSFSTDNYKITVKETDNTILTERQKGLINKILEGMSVKKLQRDVPFFLTTLNELMEKNVISLEKKSVKSRNIKFVKLETHHNAELVSVFEKFSLLPFKTAKKKIGRDFNKFLKNNLISIVEKNKYLVPETFDTAFTYERPEKLSEEQLTAWKKIESGIGSHNFNVHLIFGVTGSGKTEIYLKAIEKALKLEKSVIYLVPEISLTSNIAYILSNCFPEYEIGVYHSKITKNFRQELWKDIKNGKIRIVVGARSALFAPVENLGLIIVDEEHEQSYKQEDKPRYHGRDSAVMKGKIWDATVILGSATPSVNSYYNAKTEKYILHVLTKRVNNLPMPEIEIVDMRKEEKKQGNFSKLLLQEIEKRLEKKEQVILFQNRRGHSSFVQCVNCGKLFKCPNCEISLHYHSVTSELKCHYCGYSKPLPRKCPECGSYLYNFGSPGTQQIEKELKILFPTAKIMRMDSDTTARKESYQEMFDRMKNKEIDILLGTQMISKGLDFHNVTLVGVISADVILNYPDFRSSERTFQLLTQVAGRSGRGEKTGKVIIQTYNPEHYAITYSLQGDFELFAIEEMKFRKILKYPPYYRMARIVFLHKNYEFLKESLDKNRYLINKLKEYLPQISILGPVAPPIIKIRNEFRMHIIIKAKMPSEISKAIGYINNNFKIGSSIKKIIDIDAYSLI